MDHSFEWELLEGYIFLISVTLHLRVCDFIRLRIDAYFHYLIHKNTFILAKGRRQEKVCNLLQANREVGNSEGWSVA